MADVRIVHAGSSADLSSIERASPRVILLDVGLENGDSLALAERIGQELPDSRVVVMDLLPTEEDIRDFIEAGVSGFVMKDASLDELVKTIRSVGEGSDVLPPTMTNSLFSQIANDVVNSRDRRSATSHAVGHISVHTVKSHVRNVMEKLTLHTRLQVAAWAHHEEAED